MNLNDLRNLQHAVELVASICGSTHEDVVNAFEDACLISEEEAGEILESMQ